ncbi:MAG: tyrosine-type recombinase/integrase [Oligoflexia bacterium]|nr:tyrosine-type recombinase/integrase [Oligoflexia bacterium]
MTIYRRGKTWHAEVYVNGKRKDFRGGFSNKKEAKDWYDRAKAKILFASNDSNTKQNFMFKDLIEKYVEYHLPTILPGTSRRYMVDIKYRITPYFEFYRLEQITLQVIEDFKLGLLHTLSAKSANNCLALLKSIFRKSVEWNMIEKDPSEKINLVKQSKKKYHWWESIADIQKFLSIAKNDRYHLGHRLALDFGLRLGEIIGLTKGDINLELGHIHVHRQWPEKEGKYGPTKHGKERFLKYSKDSELASLIEEFVKNKAINSPLFTTSTGNRLRPQKLSNYYFQNLIKKAGIPRIRFHDLRHTFASWFMIKNDNIWELMRILGHADIQTTQKYAHLSSLQRSVPEFNWHV